MIQLNRISKSFGDHEVLKGLDLKIRERETLLIVGKSGSGKTVLMKIIDGLLEPDVGVVLIDGENIHKSKGKSELLIRQKLAMLFQGSALLDSLNVYQNIALPLVEHTKKTDNEIEFLVKEKLNEVGLGDIFRQLPAELSGGMKKRVALARAIVTDPKYIIYDEPTTGLDPVISREIIDMISNLHKKNELATIIVTHDLYTIEKIGGRIVMLSDGEIIFDGRLDKFKNAGDIRIRKFLDSKTG